MSHSATKAYYETKENKANYEKEIFHGYSSLVNFIDEAFKRFISATKTLKHKIPLNYNCLLLNLA